MDLQRLLTVAGACEEFLAGFGAVGHPIVRLPTAQQVAGLLSQGAAGAQQLGELLRERQAGIELMESDPLRHGYELPWWKEARGLIATHREGLVLGGNDSTKSWFAAKFGAEQLVNQPRIDWGFFHETEDASINQQQKIVYKFLPPEWRNAGKQGKFVDVCYTEAGGFKNNKFVLPNGSRGFFFFYKQDPSVLAGYKLTGACADELITMNILEELRTRMLGRGGFLLMTFTPAEGYTPVVADILAGHEVAKFMPSRHLPGHNMPNNPAAPKGHMPYVLKCRKSTQFAMCVFTEWSPFRKAGELEQMIEGKTSAYVKVRAYGWPEKQQGTAIGKFGSVHIVKRAEGAVKVPGPVPPRPWEGVGGKVSEPVSEKAGALTHSPTHPLTVPALYPQLGKVGTNYCVTDPGGSKNWVIKWYRVTPVDGSRTFVTLYREWPDLASHGEWALPGDRHDGIPGPAQRSGFGRGIVDYKRLILTLEGWRWDDAKGEWDGSQAEEIYERHIDPRMGGTEVLSQEEGTSLINLLENEDTDAKGRIIGPALVFHPAPGGSGSIAQQAGIAMLNDWFDYDVQQPVSILNCPKFYVVEDCEQSIYAYRTYTGLDGEKGALKDIVDPDWYLRKVDPDHVDAGSLKMKRGGSY